MSLRCSNSAILLKLLHTKFAERQWHLRDDHVALQYRHYKACLDIFKLQPSIESRDFSDLVGFVAQVRNFPHDEDAPQHGRVAQGVCTRTVQFLSSRRQRGCAGARPLGAQPCAAQQA